MNQLSVRNNILKVKASGKLPSFQRNPFNIFQSNEEKLKDVNMQPDGLGNARISTGCVQNSPPTLNGLVRKGNHL
jgi:hypothetical protein